jgi:ATP-dependent Lhr-like helicase
MKSQMKPAHKKMTMNLHPSNSDRSVAGASKAFDHLDEKIQRWIWSQQWNELRDIQERAIEPILSAQQDVIIASPTATGKTEAAFLPILTRILQSPSESSLDVLYISPLKALINDQFDRLELLCDHVEIPVWRWHGDVAQARKKELMRKPRGILLITPESLESIFVNHGSRIADIFPGLSYVVVDELHSFIGTERGKQLQSLLHRLETAVRRRIPRIALSATLSEFSLASEYLRPHDKERKTLVIRSEEGGQEIKIQIRGYVVRPPEIVTDPSKASVELGDKIEIAKDVYRILRGSTNLIFANRRRDVEIYADILRRMCEESGVPNEFWPHHGSLSKELREDAEAIVKNKSQPANIICTTTLEMGIDIGIVNSIAQIGPSPSVTSLRQRLGRSGRRGQPAILRIYVQEEEINPQTAIQDRLRCDLVQSIAMFELLLKGWYEPPPDAKLHLSTLIQQILSIIAQYGGIRAQDAWKLLCDQGPFAMVDKSMFVAVVRAMGAHELIAQDSEGLILLGKNGERIVNHYSFYTAFSTPEEFQLFTQDGDLLGTIPIDFPLSEGIYLIFAGRRWEVTEVEFDRKAVILKPSKGGRPPQFGGSGKSIHDKVRKEMLNLYCSDVSPPYLDARAKLMFGEARTFFKMANLQNKRIISSGDEVLLFPWCGDKVMNTLAVQLNADGFKVTLEGVALNVIGTSKQEILQYFQHLKHEKLKTAIELASTVKNKITEKYDRFLTEELLSDDYASGNLAIADSASVIDELLASSGHDLTRL